MRIFMQPQEDDFDKAVERFLSHCKSKNLSAETISTYRNKLKQFGIFLDSNDISLSDINAETIETYISWLHDNRNCNDITVNSYLRQIKAFLYWAMEYSLITPFKVHLIKADKPVKKTYSESDLEKLLKRPDLKTCSFTEFKIWAVECVFVGTGIRISTMLELRIKDLDFENGLILLCKTKNRKQVYVPMSKSVEDVLRLYLAHRKGEPDDYLFCNSYGGKGDRRTYEQHIADYNRRRLGKNAITSAHAFRHTFAKLAVMNGCDAFRLQKLMTHASVTTTQEYVNLFGNDLKEGYDKINPLDNLQIKKSKVRMDRK